MIPQAAIDLIIDAEGVDQPGHWPGEDSGITIGHGYDLSAVSREEFIHDWEEHLEQGHLYRLRASVGVSGQEAKRIAPRYLDIRITLAQADAVFYAASLPKGERETAQAFPGVTALPDAARGALVSLVFNRGTLMADSPLHRQHDRRREMRAIRDAIIDWSHLDPLSRTAKLPKVLHFIAEELRSMKRLWANRGVDGLIRRREAEARLVESAA